MRHVRRIVPALALLYPAQAQAPVFEHHYRLEPGSSHATVAIRMSGKLPRDLRLGPAPWDPGEFPTANPSAGSGRPTQLQLWVDGKKTRDLRGQDGLWQVAEPKASGLELRYRLSVTPGDLPAALGSVRPRRVERAGEARNIRRHPAWLLRGTQTFLFPRDLPGARHRLHFVLPPGWRWQSSLGRENGTRSSLGDTAALRTSSSLIMAPDTPLRAQGTLQVVGRPCPPVQLEKLASGLSALAADRPGWPASPAAATTLRLGLWRGNLRARSTPVGIELLASSARLGDHGWRALARCHIGHRLDILARVQTLPIDAAGHELMWFWIGVRSWLADLCLLRAGRIEATAYWQTQLPRLLNRAHRHMIGGKISARAASLDFLRAPRTKRDRPDLAALGYLLCQLLDLRIRRLSGDRQHLAAVCGQLPMDPQGLTIRELQKACSAAAGQDLQPFFDTWVEGIQPLPVAREYRPLGLQVRILTRAKDAGTRPARFSLRIDAAAPVAAIQRRQGLIKN